MLELFLFSSVTAFAIVLAITWDKYRGYHKLIIGRGFRYYLWERRRKAFLQYVSIKAILVLVMIGLYLLMAGMPVITPLPVLVEW